jgi:hypothetical protein
MLAGSGTGAGLTAIVSTLPSVNGSPVTTLIAERRANDIGRTVNSAKSHRSPFSQEAGPAERQQEFELRNPSSNAGRGILLRRMIGAVAAEARTPLPLDVAASLQCAPAPHRESPAGNDRRCARDLGNVALSTATAGMLLPTQRLTIDLPVLGFACAASLLAGLAFDLVPALHNGAFQSSISFAQTFALESVRTGLAVTRNWWVHGLSNGASEIRDPLPAYT